MKILKQIDFNEALERARKEERVYAIDLGSDKKVTVKLFNRLEMYDALTNDNYIYAIVEEDKA